MTGRILYALPSVPIRPAVGPKRGRKPIISDAEVTARFNDGLSDEEIASAFPGTDASYVFRRRMKLRLLRRSRSKPDAHIASRRRHSSHSLAGKPATLLAYDNPALDEGRTIYPSTVVTVDGLQSLLVSGVNSRKIGSHITKGCLKGFPIFTLTLEERATCPSSCRHWRSCYGNHLHLAKRVVHGEAFEARLESELAVLQSRFPRGFAVRLHVLGDFYSTEYVNLWAGFLRRFRSMFVFGFTARWDQADPIARELIELVLQEWPRFAIRFSNAPVDECSTVTIEHPRQKPPDAIICPAQTGKAESCGACALCWHTKKRIAFLQH